jgi:hypothetical protein
MGVQALKAQGMVVPFDARAARFTRLSTTPTFITDVLQSVRSGGGGGSGGSSSRSGGYCVGLLGCRQAPAVAPISGS